MASFIIFDRTSGMIRTTLNCPVDQMPNHLASTEDAIEHPGVSDAEFRINPATRQPVPIGG